MGQVQNAILGAVGAVGGAVLTAKKSVGKKATKEEKVAKLTSQSPSAVAAQKAQASLAEHREARTRSKIKSKMKGA